MTAKKSSKQAKSGKTPTTASKSSSGLLTRLKSALSKPKAATKAAGDKQAPKKTPVAKDKKTQSSAPASKSAKAAATKKSAAQKTAPKKPQAVTKAAASSSKPAPSAKKAPAKPASTKKNVSKTSPKAKATRSSNGPLTEEDVRKMSEADYMNDQQLEFFRERLFQMREEVLQREIEVKERLHEREVFADPADRATAEEEHWLDLRLRERESLLLRKIDDALRRIENKEYGYCEKTGDPIGVPRLLARPTATVCVDVKGQDERVEAQYRDR